MRLQPVIATITIAAFLSHMIIAAKQSTIDVQSAQIDTLKKENKRAARAAGRSWPI